MKMTENGFSETNYNILYLNPPKRTWGTKIKEFFKFDKIERAAELEYFLVHHPYLTLLPAFIGMPIAILVSIYAAMTAIIAPIAWLMGIPM